MVIGDSVAIYVLSNIPDTNVYLITTYYFCGCLQLIVYGLPVEELSAISRAIMLLSFMTLPKNNQYVLIKTLEVMWDRAKRHIISKIKVYANIRFETSSGVEYQKEYIKLVYVSISILFMQSLYTKFY